MILNVFLPFFLSFSLSSNWEREGIGRNSLKVYLSLRLLSFGEYFLFLLVDEIYLCISLWLEGTEFLFLSKILSAFFTRRSVGTTIRLSTTSVQKLFFTRSLAWDPFTTTTVPKLIFLFPISADGRRGLFPLWNSSQSFGFYLLPSPVRRFEWGHGVQIAWPTFFLPSTASRSWPTFFICLLTVNLWLIQTRRNSSNSLFLFFQWETTWQL